MSLLRNRFFLHFASIFVLAVAFRSRTDLFSILALFTASFLIGIILYINWLSSPKIIVKEKAKRFEGVEDAPISKAFEPVRLSPTLELKNRFCKAATWEGLYTEEAIPSDRLKNFHATFAKNGVALTTVSYGCINESGLTYKKQLLLSESACRNSKLQVKMREIANHVHAQGGRLSVQLTHAGYMADESVTKNSCVSASKIFSPMNLHFAKEMAKSDITTFIKDFTRAAVFAKDCGFDAIEVHAGHGYLLSQFLSPFTNSRRDEYGGSSKNRARFATEVVASIRAAVGPDFPILMKMNVTDGEDTFRLSEGISEADVVIAAQEFESAGASCLVMTGGFILKNGLGMLRGGSPVWSMMWNSESLMKSVGMFLFGWLLIPQIPFQEAFFMERALLVRKAVKIPLMLLGGLHSTESICRALGAGFDLIGLGRPLLAERDFIAKLKAEAFHQSPCKVCNDCVFSGETQEGVRCLCLNTTIEW